ncbi:hypothetical protein NDU88_000101 [Pleurodeles waltl]|uniref:Uncharacterized protein n=1 Tax=Pleurodeles waltl TaxID=8319 RepID=A0AAV7UPT5_PLEWA|nr:hypothetical protein NDU88_000101 [Pleurodeles waltl]
MTPQDVNTDIRIKKENRVETRVRLLGNTEELEDADEREKQENGMPKTNKPGTPPSKTPTMETLSRRDQTNVNQPHGLIRINKEDRENHLQFSMVTIPAIPWFPQRGGHHPKTNLNREKGNRERKKKITSDQENKSQKKEEKREERNPCMGLSNCKPSSQL